MDRGMLYDNVARMAAWTPMVLAILAIGSTIALWLARKKLRMAQPARLHRPRHIKADSWFVNCLFGNRLRADGRSVPFRGKAQHQGGQGIPGH
jgi:hypothetical protein